jgi:hypothetical protein
MYINNLEIVPQQFLVCEFYGVETCFCWNTDKLITLPYTRNDSVARDTQVLLTPNPIRKIQCYDGRVFLMCEPQGIYKLSRTNDSFAVLSKNALAMGAEYWEVIVTYRNGVYLDNKQTKTSRLLFHCSITSKTIEKVHALSLNLKNTKTQFINSLIISQESEQNLCVFAYDRKLFVARADVVQLIYTSDITIVNIVPVKQDNKIAGLLLHLINMDTVILVHSKEYNLIFKKIHLGKDVRNTSTLCVGFSLQTENVIWIVYCDQYRTYYMKKELFTEVVQQTQVDERTFRCMQHYKTDVIIALSHENELIEFSLEKFESFLPVINDISLCINMFQKTDFIMEKICAKAKELNVLYKSLADEQDKLRRINLYASKQKLKINPHIEVSRLCQYRYLILDISDKLPKHSHAVVTFISKNRNIFCIKEITDMNLTIKMPIKENEMLHSSTFSMDLITLLDEGHPWCLIRDFIDCPSQNIKKKRELKRDKTVFIDTKIMSLQNLIKDKHSSMTKLCEIKKVIRAELYPTM